MTINIHMGIPLVFISFLAINSVLAANKNDKDVYYCNHGESQNDLSYFDIIKCPSKICMRFSAVCNNYWALTCYNENDPMFLFKNFSMAQKLYKNDPESATFETCINSKCNTFNYSKTFNVNAIAKPPLTFDPLLSTNLPKEKLYRDLQNKLYLYNSQAENKTLIVIFDTIKTTKQAWISLDLRMNNNSTIRRKLIFDFVNGKVKLLKWVQLTNSTKPGGKLYFVVESTLKGIRIFINNIFHQNLDKKVKEIVDIFYGGEMSYNNSTLTNNGIETSLWGYDPSFYPNLVPAKQPKSTKINSTKLKITTVRWKPDTSYLKYPITPLKNFEKMNFEFRSSYKPNSNLIRIQIQAVPSNATSKIINYHTFIWYRIDSQWATYGKIIVKNCKKPNLFMTWGTISFYCDNSSKHSIAVYDIQEFSKFLYRNAKVQKFTCLT